MIKYFLSILKHYLFWFLFFAFGRIFFLIANQDLILEIPKSEIFATFWHALLLDYSAISYILVIPFILLTLQLIFNRKFLNLLLKIYMITFIILCSILIFSDISIYDEWSLKINYKAIAYLKNPSEVIESASSTHTLTVILGTIFLSFISIYSYLHWIIKPHIDVKKRFYIPAFFILLIGLGIQFIGIRGGVSPIPISQSAAYFSKHQILNDAAVNVPWNLMHSSIRFSSLNYNNPFAHLDETTARATIKELFTVPTDSSLSVLKSENINIVLIVLESWSADLIETITGEEGITPFFHELEKGGILFTQLYANGHRSQQGLSAILSGFPPIPIQVITDNIEKYQNLNSLVKDLKKVGYQSSFYFGGDLVYGNLKAYIMFNGFDKIVEEKDFPKDLARGKLTIYDEEVLSYHVKDMRNEKEPFFSMIFTGSTHSPYDEPKKVEQLTWECAELAYLNSAKYTDYCLKKYFDLVKNEPWYDNTLFILVADHSHKTHKQNPYHSPDYQHIPMLWFGKAIKDEYRGTTINAVCSQVDIPLTLLRQLHLPTEHYRWSLDIFNPTTEKFAAFETQWGMNWIRENHFLRYDGFKDYFYPTENENDSLLNKEKLYLKSYLQVLYDEYINY
ncbi:MAG TPA: sulfatase-like hydrolase/transferase [Bacteroidales bacterium]|nr:sulfatase-like hydrolase/transferase [Bacteroidales bacterium]